MGSNMGKDYSFVVPSSHLTSGLGLVQGEPKSLLYARQRTSTPGKFNKGMASKSSYSYDKLARLLARSQSN
jgi:hypothetical protein